MWFRSRIRPFAAAALLGLTLAGCSDIYYDRRDAVSLASGEAMAANRVTHMIDPWPPASAKRDIAFSGDRAQMAAECYRLGKVIKPVNATTSSAAYSQSTTTTSTPCNAQTPAVPSGGAIK